MSFSIFSLFSIISKKKKKCVPKKLIEEINELSSQLWHILNLHLKIWILVTTTKGNGILRQLQGSNYILLSFINLYHLRHLKEFI